MDIKEYYRKTARISFIVSCISFTLTIFTLIYFILNDLQRDMFSTIIPFVCVGSVYLASFFINQKRYKDVPAIIKSGNVSFWEVQDLLMAHMPAPTLRILLFKPNGELVGELRDQNMKWYMWLLPNQLTVVLPKKYGLYDSNNQLLASYSVGWGITNKTKMFDETNTWIGTYEEDWKNSMIKITGTVKNHVDEPWMPIQISGFLQQFSIKDFDGKRIASFQKGWMPLQWGKIFKEINTPILTFSELADKRERIAVFGLCASFMHHNKN